MNRQSRFPALIFRIAAIYGIATLLPQYFLERWIGEAFPPAITHPELFYGFIGVALVWQFVFLLIAHDVRRYRPLMVLAVLEKLSFGIAAVVLFAQGRVTSSVAGAGAVDLVLAILFLVAFRATPPMAGGEGKGQ
jgi:hypothetical protein